MAVRKRLSAAGLGRRIGLPMGSGYWETADPQLRADSKPAWRRCLPRLTLNEG